MSLRSRRSSKMYDDTFAWVEDMANGKEQGHEKKAYKSKEFGIPWHWCILAVAICCVMYYLVHAIDYVLPTPVTMDDLENNNQLFSAEHSREILRKLCALGPRSVGSESNEVLAPKLIIGEVEKIVEEKNPAQSILYDQQRGSGAYTMAYESRPSFINVYENVVNVLVMLEGSDGNHGIFINCHFDSRPEQEGAADDALSCAIMLEVLRAMSQRKERPKHSVVFLFNGAEEVGLQASHLYLDHPWSNKTHVVVNLEAAGSGGRELVFQSGPEASWIFNYYAKHAPHPHAQVLIEEMFQLGVIPSDTDFRVFRDFGKKKGLDMAFGRNGYVYHTKYDREIYIPLGSHQHMGDNVLAVALALANAPELEDMKGNEGGQMVFYDYLGWFMVSYTEGVGIGINVLAILMTIGSIAVFVRVLSRINGNDSMNFRTTKRLSVKCIIIELLILLLARILGIALGIGIVVAIASIIHSAASLSMVWFSNVWLIFPLYWCPCLLANCFVSHLVGLWRCRRLKISSSVITQMDLIVSQIPCMLFLLILTCIGMRSASTFFLLVLSSAVANIVIHSTPLYRTAFYWIWAYLIIHLFSFVMMLYYVLIAYIILLPIMGRQGYLNAELYIGVVSAALCPIVTTFIVPFIHMVRKSYAAYLVLAAFSFVMIVLASSTDVGFPYRAGPSTPSPQRYWLIHSLREFRNDSNHVRRSDTGYLVMNLDVNSPKTIAHKIRSPTTTLEQDCDDEQFCGIPVCTTRYVPITPESTWIRGPAPVQPTHTELILKEKECRNMDCSMTFTLKGSDRMTLMFSTRSNSRLKDWSLPAEILQAYLWKGNPAYMLHICRGLSPNDFEITFRFEVTGDTSLPIIDIALVSNHVHHMEYRTKDYREFIASFPDWTDVTGWISIYRSYVF